MSVLDQGDFLRLFLPAQRVLRAYLHAATRDANETDELLQQVSQVLWEKFNLYDATRPFGPWLMRIVMNRGANLRRSRTRRETEPETDAVSPAPSALEES